MKPRSYQNLIVWQKGFNVANHLYEITRSFPSDEKFGLVSQMRRAAVSIPSNIAEGCERRSPGDLRRFLHIALGSLSELETQLLLSQHQGYITPTTFSTIQNELNEVGRLLHCFIKKT